MSDSIFWLQVRSDVDPRDVILGASFDDAIAVLRAVDYRQIIMDYNFGEEAINKARNCLREDETLLGHLRQAYVDIFDVASRGGDELSLKLAGFRIKQALQHLHDGFVDGHCPIVPVGQKIAREVHKIAVV